MSSNTNPVTPPLSVKKCPLYAAALVFDDGCNGPTAAALLLSPQVGTRAEQARDWEAARSTEKARSAALAQEFPLPPYRNSSERWEGTYQEHCARLAAEKELRSTTQAVISAALQETMSAFWTSRGYEPYEFTGPGYWGLDYEDDRAENLGYPLAITHRRGCRCAGGHIGYAEWASDDDLTPEVLVITTSDVSYVAAASNGTFPPAVESSSTLSAVFDSANLASAVAVSAVETAYQQRLWASRVTEEQLGEMDYDTFQAYQKLRPMRMGQSGWDHSANPTPIRSDVEARDKGFSAARSVLSKAGLYRLTPLYESIR
jgi:hypothetical protein